MFDSFPVLAVLTERTKLFYPWAVMNNDTKFVTNILPYYEYGTVLTLIADDVNESDMNIQQLGADYYICSTPTNEVLSVSAHFIHPLT